MGLSIAEIEQMGFASVGSNVMIDPRSAIFGASHIHLGDNVRIDCFAVVSAGPGIVRLGNYVHVASGANIYGGGGVTMDDFSEISGGVALYSVSDDFVGGYMTNPTVPEAFRNVNSAPIHLGRHVAIGARSVVLPGVDIGRGASIGALSLVKKDVPEYTVMGGNPLRPITTRNKQRLTDLETAFYAEQRND